MRKQLTPSIVPRRRNERGDLKSKTGKALRPQPRTSPPILQVDPYITPSRRHTPRCYESVVTGGVPRVISGNTQSHLEAILACLRAGNYWGEIMDQSDVDR
jgi:hypothetical protein